MEPYQSAFRALKSYMLAEIIIMSTLNFFHLFKSHFVPVLREKKNCQNPFIIEPFVALKIFAF